MSSDQPHKAVTCLALVFAAMAAAAGPGRAPSAADTGVYTPAQAAAGRQVYESHCARCHGRRLEGGMGPPLAGEHFARSLEVDGLTGPQLYDFITSHMPRAQPGLLTDKHYLEAFAFLLSANGYPSGPTALTKQTLGTVALRPYPGRGRNGK